MIAVTACVAAEVAIVYLNFFQKTSSSQIFNHLCAPAAERVEFFNDNYMQTRDIISIERQNGDGIFLYKEGIFWRTYNQSAFQFSKHFKAFKLTKKFVKSVGEEVISLGFPDKLLSTILESAKDNNWLVEQNENKIQISGLPELPKETYEEWATKVLVKTVAKDNKDQNSVSHSILKRIQSYPIMEKSPLETQRFILELQKTINGLS